MITYLQFWKSSDARDRRETYASVFSPEIEAHGTRTVDACAPLIAEYEAETGRKINQCASGWRPAAVNEHTANAGALSAHITAEAEDITADDDLEMRGEYGSSRFARWCAAHQDRLKHYGLYMEDWHYTAKRNPVTGHWSVWGHLSTRPPKSGHTMYMPFDPAKNPPQVPLSEAA